MFSQNKGPLVLRIISLRYSPFSAAFNHMNINERIKKNCGLGLYINSFIFFVLFFIYLFN